MYIAVRSDLTPGLQLAQAVHAAFHFFAEWPSMSSQWLDESNYLVVVSVRDEQALAELAARAVEEGLARTLVREPDLDNSLTAVALQPGEEARRLCANYPLALREPVMI